MKHLEIPQTAYVPAESSLEICTGCPHVRPLHLICYRWGVALQEFEERLVFQQDRGLNDLHVGCHAAPYRLQHGKKESTQFCRRLYRSLQCPYMRAKEGVTHHDPQTFCYFCEISRSLDSNADFHDIKPVFELDYGWYPWLTHGGIKDEDSQFR